MNININENQLETDGNKFGNNNIKNKLNNYKLLDIKVYQYSNNNYKSPCNLIYQYYIDEFELFIGKIGDGKTIAINTFFNIIKGIKLEDK